MHLCTFLWPALVELLHELDQLRIGLAERQ
jgi:hypothetical protein